MRSAGRRSRKASPGTGGGKRAASKPGTGGGKKAAKSAPMKTVKPRRKARSAKKKSSR